MTLNEKNKLLEEAVEDLGEQIEIMNNKIGKGVSGTEVKDNEKTYGTSEIRILLDESSNLRSKNVNEKMKRTNAKEGSKLVKNELLDLKLKGTRKLGSKKLWICLVIVVVVILLLRVI